MCSYFGDTTLEVDRTITVLTGRQRAWLCGTVSNRDLATKPVAGLEQHGPANDQLTALLQRWHAGNGLLVQLFDEAVIVRIQINGRRRIRTQIGQEQPPVLGYPISVGAQ